MLWKFAFALVVFNIVAGSVFGYGWVYANYIASTGAPMRMANLDRQGVINEEKLKEIHPELVENLRNDLGRWIAENERNASTNAATLGFVVSTINGVISFLFFLSVRRARKSGAEPTYR